MGIFDDVSIGTFSTGKESRPITMADLEETKRLLKKASIPLNKFHIMVNEYLPKGSIMVSKDVYEEFKEALQDKVEK